MNVVVANRPPRAARGINAFFRWPWLASDPTRFARWSTVARRGVKLTFSSAVFLLLVYEVLFLVAEFFLPSSQYTIARKQNPARTPSVGTAAIDLATAWPGKPFACMHNGFVNFEECQILQLNGPQPQPSSTADKHPPVSLLDINLSHASVTKPALSMLLMQTHQSTTTSGYEEADAMPTRYITIHTTRTKTVTSYRYSLAAASSTAPMYGSNGSLPTPTAYTCALNERPSLPIASTSGIDEDRSRPAHSTCDLHECPAYSTVSTCGLGGQSTLTPTSTWHPGSSLQFSVASMCAAIERPHTA